MGTELPLAQAGAAAGGIGPLPTLLLLASVLLALAAGLMAFSALGGRISRQATRAENARSGIGAGVAGLLAIVLGYFAWSQAALSPAFESVTAFAIAGALTIPLVLISLGLLLATTLTRGEGRPRQLLAGQLLADLFAFWLPKRRHANGSGAEDDADFEITMASGEEVEAEEREYIENILEMGETTAQSVMTPRTDVEALDVNWPAARIVEVVAQSNHSRFPVYDGTSDNVVGVLHLRNLLEFLARGVPLAELDLRELLLEAYFVPASRKVDDVLRDLQRQKCHLAVVLDEYGGTAGILTIEDLLEEIVGEIQDEHDEESRQVHALEDGALLISAQMPLDDLNQLLGTALSAEDVDTLGGFITHMLGRIPQARETVTDGGWRFSVLSVEKNRIGRVRVEREAGE